MNESVSLMHSVRESNPNSTFIDQTFCPPSPIQEEMHAPPIFERKKIRSDTFKKVNIFKSKEDKTGKYFKYYICFNKILDSRPLTILISLFTIYALFGDDIRLLATPKSSDPAFDALTIICFILFCLEILLSLGVKKGYLFSFFFWLDVISTATLILDISEVNEQLL